MGQAAERNDIAKFVEQIRRDPKYRQAIWDRPQGRPAPLKEAVDYTIAVASELGFRFTREELTEYVRVALERPTEVDRVESDGDSVTLSVGALGFGRVVVGLSNPSEVMCQYHAPQALLANPALRQDTEA